MPETNTCPRPNAWQCATSETHATFITYTAGFCVSYEDPFGDILVADDTDASGTVDENPFRFSTKYHDDETGSVYYGFRHCSPELGRWISRDPAGEEECAGVYVFTCNLPTRIVDVLGLANLDPILNRMKRIEEQFDPSSEVVKLSNVRNALRDLRQSGRIVQNWVDGQYKGTPAFVYRNRSSNTLYLPRSAAEGTFVHGFRHYSPKLGRWISKDPIADVASRLQARYFARIVVHGLYRFLNNGPEGFVDPLGFCEFIVAAHELQAAGEDDNSSEAIQRRVGRALPLKNIVHTDVYRGRKQIRLGFAGGITADVEIDLTGYKMWLLRRVKKGKLRWGDFAGTSCDCANDDMIADCVRSAPAPRREEFNAFHNNCQTDVQHAIEGCCLTGFNAAGAEPAEWNYLTDKERQATLDESFEKSGRDPHPTGKR